MTDRTANPAESDFIPQTVWCVCIREQRPGHCAICNLNGFVPNPDFAAKTLRPAEKE